MVSEDLGLVVVVPQCVATQLRPLGLLHLADHLVVPALLLQKPLQFSVRYFEEVRESGENKLVARDASQ